MRKLIMAGLLVMALAGCNRQIFDFKLKFDTAYVKWPDGTVKEIKIKKWNDYPDSDAVQIIDYDDNVYLTHYVNVVLVHREGR